MIKDFLVTAKFDALCLGLSQAEVRRLLGAPEEYSESNRKTEIWKYGGLEVAFNKGSLYFIGLYFDNGIVMLPSTLIKEGKIRIKEQRLVDFEKFLRANNIDFVVDQDLTFDQQRYLRLTRSQVGVCFVRGRLKSIQLTE